MGDSYCRMAESALLGPVWEGVAQDLLFIIVSLTCGKLVTDWLHDDVVLVVALSWPIHLIDEVA